MLALDDSNLLITRSFLILGVNRVSRSAYLPCPDDWLSHFFLLIACKVIVLSDHCFTFFSPLLMTFVKTLVSLI